ncbi:MAG: glutathione S-transferase family protein [Myxococcales bacterium]|nr:glutathione S-transferase family protein [Myxococcales bacterium]
MQTLVTISFSHYCEKARWALDLVGKPYREEGHLPLFHFVPVALATRGARDKHSDSVSSPYSTPVLITDAGDRVCDSSRIMHHLSDREGLHLYADAESGELDAKFSEKLGQHTRRFGYHHMLRNPSLFREFVWSLGNKPQAIGAIATRPIYEQMMRKALRINAKSAERSREKVLAFANEIEVRLSDGRPYLCGESFGAADLSFAALFAPSLLLTKDEGYGSEFPSMERAGGEVAAFARELRSRRVGEFVLAMYRDHRGRSAACS